MGAPVQRPEHEFIQQQLEEPAAYYVKEEGTTLEWMGLVVIPLLVAVLGVWAQRHPPSWAKALLEKKKRVKE